MRTTTDKEGPGPFSRFLMEIDRYGKARDAVALEMLHGLCRLLQTQIRRRGLWDQPTVFLGVQSSGTWFSEAGADSWPSEALRELGHDFFAHLAEKQLESLWTLLQERQSELGPNADVDGNVRLYARNFVAERQGVNDRIGLRIYNILVRDLQTLVAEERLQIPESEKKIRNGMIFSFEDRGAIQPEPPEGSENLLDSICAKWVGRLMPGLMTAEGRARTQIREELRSAILGLPSEGISIFSFGQLIRPFRRHVRIAMRDLYVDKTDLGLEDGEFSKIGGDLLSIEQVELKDSFEKIVECVERKIGSLGASHKKQKLDVLWGYFREFAINDEGRVLSAVLLGQKLSIPRNSIPNLRATLGRFLETCKTQLSSQSLPLEEHSGHLGGKHD